METTETPKRRPVEATNPKNYPLRVSRETRRRILTDLARVNKKEHGKKVKPNDLIALALTLLEPKHYVQLVQAAMTNADRIEQRYRNYVKQHGPTTKDAFLGMLLAPDDSAASGAPAPLTTGEAGLI